jgi:hypothetical protein
MRSSGEGHLSSCATPGFPLASAASVMRVEPAPLGVLGLRDELYHGYGRVSRATSRRLRWSCRGTARGYRCRRRFPPRFFLSTRLAFAWMRAFVDAEMRPFLYCCVARAFAFAARPGVSMGYLRDPGRANFDFGSLRRRRLVSLGDLHFATALLGQRIHRRHVLLGTNRGAQPEDTVRADRDFVSDAIHDDVAVGWIDGGGAHLWPDPRRRWPMLILALRFDVLLPTVLHLPPRLR